MSSFTMPLVISPLIDGRHWELQEPFTYHVGHEDSFELITVPRLFVTDFASVPRPFFWLIPPWGRYGKAAIVHDYLYPSENYSRKQADDIFLEAMIVLEVAPWRRKLMYWGVRAFGWLAWK